MNIGVLSGKGGTGKTLLSTNMAVAMAGNYIDCDVEEPNGFIFLQPEEIVTEEVSVKNPVVDTDKCTLCGKCVESCNFNALAKTKKIVFFEKLCHSCGACKLVCPEGAISYEKRAIGIIDRGRSEGINCVQGKLNVGEAMAVPVIKAVLKSLPKELNIVDCAPGTSCNVVNTLEHMDKAVLVTEPTKFGLHDLERAVELCRREDIPYGIVINRVVEKENLIESYCKENSIVVLGRIPYEREIAEIYSRGELLIKHEKYRKLLEGIEAEIGRL